RSSALARRNVDRRDRKITRLLPFYLIFLRKGEGEGFFRGRAPSTEQVEQPYGQTVTRHSVTWHLAPGKWGHLRPLDSLGRVARCRLALQECHQLLGVDLAQVHTGLDRGRGSGVVGYNVQVAVDTEHHLIITHEVTNDGSDRAQLANIAFVRSPVVSPAIGRSLCDALQTSGRYPLALPPPLVAQ